MPLNNRMFVGRSIGNHHVSLRPGQHKNEKSGGAISKISVNKVSPQVNLTNGIAGVGTMQNYTPKMKESPVFMTQNRSILEDFKSLSFGKKKKTNIKLKL
jgi:hypothetical protein